MHTKKTILVITLLAVAILQAPVGIYAKPDITIHKTNFYLFEKDGEVFYPYTANIGFLLNPSVQEGDVEKQIETLAKHKINTLRITIDRACPLYENWNTFETSKGELAKAVINRLDFIFTLAERHGMYAILSFFDTQSIAAQWEKHPYNANNGGQCERLEDFFTNPDSILRCMRRVKQIVSRYQERPVLAWEVGRGVNIGDLQSPPDMRFEDPVLFWVLRVIDEIKHDDQEKHLIALSFAPNTMPTRLMSLVPVKLLLLQIQSRDPFLTAKSAHSFIQEARKNKKPVFICEGVWKGNPNEQEEFFKNLLWPPVVSTSGAFAGPPHSGANRIASAELSQLEAVWNFNHGINLAGVPRPPSKAPIELDPKDTFFLADNLVGEDWIFWLLRKKKRAKDRRN